MKKNMLKFRQWFISFLSHDFLQSVDCESGTEPVEDVIGLPGRDVLKAVIAGGCAAIAVSSVSCLSLYCFMNVT